MKFVCIYHLYSETKKKSSCVRTAAFSPSYVTWGLYLCREHVHTAAVLALVDSFCFSEFYSNSGNVDRLCLLFSKMWPVTFFCLLAKFRCYLQ